jgi:hypothetical protein
MKKTGLVLMILMMVWGMTACGKGSQSTSSQPTVAPVEPKNEIIAPLTGLPTTVPNDNRVVMVMINNHTKARPQSGLDQADVVYEILEEGLITRFMAFYQSELPEVVGPVRSIRPYNITLAEAFDSIISHAGGSEAALSTLRQGNHSDLDEIYRYNKAYWRIHTRKAPHNLYTSIPALRKGAEAMGYPVKGNVPSFTFRKATDEVQGEKAETINVFYAKGYTAEYAYDSQTKQYKRLTVGQLLKNKETGKQVEAANVMVLSTNHRIVDSKGHLEINVNGPGEGYLFQRGKAMKITWELKDGMLRAYQNGQEVPMYPGKTWVNVVPIKTNGPSPLTFK